MDSQYVASVGPKTAPDVSVEVEVAVAEDEGRPSLDEPWHVILFNDEDHAFDEVVLQVVKATQCGMRKATEVTLEAHTSGSAGVFTGEIEDCLRVQRVLQEIELGTEIRG